MRTAHLHNEAGLFAILELDRNRELAESVGLDLSLPDNLAILDAINRQLLTLSQEVTGVIFDPIYTHQLLADKAATAGALLRLEQDKLLAPEELPALFPNFSLEEIANNYALAKLELHYQLGEAKAIEKRQLLAEIREYSKVLGIDFLLSLRTAAAENDQLLAIQELRGLADLLVIQNPADPLAMATIVSELDIPCLVTNDAADSYEQFKEKFRMAMENGARGYCLGAVLWRELGDFRGEDQSLDLAGICKYLATTVRDRILELNRIAAESLQI